MRPVVIIISIGWVLFWVYWIYSARQSKKSLMPANAKQFVGIRLFLYPLAIILALIFNRLPDSVKSHYQSVHSSDSMIAVGLLLFGVGISLAIWARINLGKNWGMPMTQKQDAALVTSGPYRYIRHPIYSGLLLMILGSAFDINIFWLLVFIVASVYFIYSAVFEERLMLREFPKTYPAYMKRTKMLVPFIF